MNKRTTIWTIVAVWVLIFASMGGIQVGSMLADSTHRVVAADTFNVDVLNACGVVTNGRGHGSCVAIGPDLVLTVGHCIGYEGVYVEINGVKYEILEEWKSDIYDVGLIRISGTLDAYCELGEMPLVLDEVFLVGSPYKRIFSNTITKGIVSALRRSFAGSGNLIQTDAEGAPGSSGGPLFDDSGKVIGLCVAGPNPGGGVVCCVPVMDIKVALEEYEDAVAAR